MLGCLHCCLCAFRGSTSNIVQGVKHSVIHCPCYELKLPYYLLDLLDLINLQWFTVIMFDILYLSTIVGSHELGRAVIELLRCGMLEFT